MVMRQAGHTQPESARGFLRVSASQGLLLHQELVRRNVALVLVAGRPLLPGWVLGLADVSQIERAAGVEAATGRRVAGTGNGASQPHAGHRAVGVERGR